MSTDRKTDNIADFVRNSHEILIICHNNGNDSLATGISLAKYIEKEHQKNPSVIYHGDFAQIDADLLSLHEIKEDFEAKTLRIVLDYKDTDIETINWYKDDDTSKLYMEIGPVGEEFSTERVSYTTHGKDYDLIICVGVQNLTDLGDLYTSHKATFEAAKIINFDNSTKNQNFGVLNIVNQTADSLSSMLLSKFAEWQYIPDKEVSKSLLVGIIKS